MNECGNSGHKWEITALGLWKCHCGAWTFRDPDTDRAYQRGRRAGLEEAARICESESKWIDYPQIQQAIRWMASEILKYAGPRP